jgi:Lrp/AsnC family leucine-responsive transcriptional regulator
VHEEKLDQIDLKILSLLQERGRMKRNVLAEEVHLSIPSVSERLRKLQEHGFIRNYRAILDPQQLGLEVGAYIVVISEASVHYDELVKKALAHPEIIECHAVTGDGSHLLKVRTRSTSTLERLLSEVQSWPGVKNTKTSIVLSSPKETTVLPLSHLEGNAHPPRGDK